MSSAPDPAPDSPAPSPEERTVTVAPASARDTPAQASDETGSLLNASHAPGERPHEPIQAPAPPGYELLAEVGRGGMGVVYKALQRGLNRLVALKVVLAGGHASVAQRLRFLAEAEAVAALNHPGIIGVYEFGTLDGQPYMALEYCPGGTLADRLRGTPHRPRDAATLIEKVARAIAVAHERGVVHRDIKPANILLAADGSPKITDFGLAKMMDQLGSLTVTGAVMGTPSYMAPEQARGDAKTVGPPADVYALGAVLYECLTGRPPFRGANPADTIVQSLEREPVGVRALNPVVPVDLETVCLKCLEKESSRRYPHAAAFADDVARFLTGRPVVARPVGPLGRARRWVSRNQVVTGLLAAIVLAVAAGTTATYVKYLDEAAQHAVAEREREKAEAETAAKEEALRQLRKTLGELETVSEEQRLLLAKLTVEKAATEDALLRGLLRPLRNQSNSLIALEEARVLFEAAALPEERLRFRFVERGLGSAEDAEKIAAWPHEVVAAAVGLDRAAAVRLRGAVGRILRAPATKPDVRVACAALVGALPQDDHDLDLAAALTLAKQMAEERDHRALAEPYQLLRPLAPRLRPADAAKVARVLNARLAREPDTTTLGELAPALTVLANRLDPAEAAALARPLLDRLEGGDPAGLSTSSYTDALAALSLRAGPEHADAFGASFAKALVSLIQTEKDAGTLHSFAVNLGLYADQLPGREGRVVGPALRALAARMASEKDAQFISQASSSMSWLGPRGTPGDVLAATTTLVERMRAEKDTSALSSLGSAMNPLVPALPVPDASTLARTFADRMAAEPDIYLVNVLAWPLVQFADRMPPDQAAAMTRPVALAAVARIPGEKDAGVVLQAGNILSHVARFLTPADAAGVMMILVERIATEKETVSASHLLSAVNAAAARLDPRDAAPFARILAARLAVEKDALGAMYLSSPAMELVGRLTPGQAATLLRPAVLALTGRATSDRDSSNNSYLAAALTTVAAHAGGTDAAPAARRLAARILTDRDGTVTNALMSPFLTLAGRVGGSEEAALVSAVGRALGERVATEKSINALSQLQMGFGQIAPRLPRSDAVATARAFAARLATERDVNVLNYMENPISLVAPQLDPAEAAAFARAITPRLAEKDYSTLSVATTALGALARRLAPEDAGPVAKEIARRLVKNKDSSIVSMLSSAFSNLAPRLSDADLLALLKANAPYPPIRGPVLAEFGRRSALAHTTPAFAAAGVPGVVATPSPGFVTIWEFVDWAEKERPDWDLRITRFQTVGEAVDSVGP